MSGLAKTTNGWSFIKETVITEIDFVKGSMVKLTNVYSVKMDFKLEQVNVREFRNVREQLVLSVFNACLNIT
jgi:hypothetical protein